MHDTGLDLGDDDMNELFATFDKDGSGSIHYNEFLQAIRVSVFSVLINTFAANCMAMQIRPSRTQCFN